MFKIFSSWILRVNTFFYCNFQDFEQGLSGWLVEAKSENGRYFDMTDAEWAQMRETASALAEFIG